MKRKKLLIILTIIIIIAFVVTIFFIKNNNTNDVAESEQNEQYFKQKVDNSKVNISKQLNESKEFDGFKISNIKLTEKDKEVVFIADITNISGKDTEDFTYFNITFFDDKNQEIGSFPGAISEVKNNETTTLNSSVNGDIANYINAYDLKLTIDTSR